VEQSPSLNLKAYQELPIYFNVLRIKHDHVGDIYAQKLTDKIEKAGTVFSLQ